MTEPSRSRVCGSTPSVRALKSVYASSNYSKSDTSEESSWLLTSEFEPELSLASSSELPFALSSFLGGMGTSLAEDSLTSAVFARFVGGSTGAQTGVSSNRLALSCLTTNKSETSFNGIRSAEAASAFSGRFLSRKKHQRSVRFQLALFFLLYAAWVRSRAERPSVSYTKVVMEVAWTGHNLQFTKTN